MKQYKILCFTSIVLLSGCFRDLSNGFDEGGPITRHTGGRWELVKVISPSGEKTGPQIGYTELLERGNDQVHNYDKVFRDDSLVSTYFWLRTPVPLANTQDMTVVVSYDNGLKRFFKIKEGPLLGKNQLETSGYVSQVGSKQDTVRYYYVAVD